MVYFVKAIGVELFVFLAVCMHRRSLALLKPWDHAAVPSEKDFVQNSHIPVFMQDSCLTCQSGTAFHRAARTTGHPLRDSSPQSSD